MRRTTGRGQHAQVAVRVVRKVDDAVIGQRLANDAPREVVAEAHRLAEWIGDRGKIAAAVVGKQRGARLRAGAQDSAYQPAMTVIAIVRGREARRLLKGDTAQRVERRGDRTPGGRTLNEGTRRRCVGTGIR